MLTETTDAPNGIIFTVCAATVWLTRLRSPKAAKAPNLTMLALNYCVWSKEKTAVVRCLKSGSKKEKSSWQLAQVMSAGIRAPREACGNEPPVA